MNKLSMKHKRYIFGILALGCMALIFFFSSQNIQDSGKVSGKVTQQIVAGTKEVVKNETLQQQIISNLQTYMRKYAHAIIFAVFGAILTGMMQLYPLKQWKRVGLAVGASFLYGCVDEVHQLFVDGRGARFSDACIDTLGALLGSLLVVLVVAIYQRIKKKQPLSVERG